MIKSVTLAVAGGDVRQAHLAALLLADGHTVHTFALERHQPAGCTPYSDPRPCFADVQVVILPMPVQHGDGQLNAPLANAPHPLADVLDAIPAGTLTLAGAVPFWVHARAVQNGLPLTDYLTRDELAIRNAVPTSLAVVHILLVYISVFALSLYF
nr:dipicolinate synthase subunit A N-terminal domain-containing protein [uncultured Agathobaculum sp.]